jgi:hypothetical protein
MEPCNAVDDEWTKFMTRLNRQQNCEDCDDEIDEDDSSRCGGYGGDHSTNRVEVAATMRDEGRDAPRNTTMMTSDVATAKPKRSCISKKQQRKLYSFVDDLCSTHSVVEAEAAAPAAATIEEVDATRPAAPTSTSIYISTKTKIAYLNKPVDIYKLFWDVPVLHYYKRREGVIKKQIKFQTTDPAVVAGIKEKLQNQPRCYEEHIIEHIDNPSGRIPFKDQRKISIGLCKKDLLGGNYKKKRAFFNCVVLIFRINGGKCENPDERAPEDDILYKEMHVKVFNTGKLEIPGIQEDKTLVHVLDLLVSTLRPFIGDDLSYLKDRCETALINSNFNCGFFIDRDKLFHLLKYKYRINTNYDSCSYPGIQCKFYYIPSKKEQNGQQPLHLDDNNYYEVSFMIFRTGSILIVGKCNEEMLNVIYRFIKNILETEFTGIQMGLVVQKVPMKESIEEGECPSIGSGDAAATAATAACESYNGGHLGKSNLRMIRKKKVYVQTVEYYQDSEEEGGDGGDGGGGDGGDGGDGDGK